MMRRLTLEMRTTDKDDLLVSFFDGEVDDLSGRQATINHRTNHVSWHTLQQNEHRSRSSPSSDDQKRPSFSPRRRELKVGLQEGSRMTPPLSLDDASLLGQVRWDGRDSSRSDGHNDRSGSLDLPFVREDREVRLFLVCIGFECEG
jgi:hypothetical protein